MLGYNLLAKPEAYVDAAEGRDGFWRWYGMDEEGNKICLQPLKGKGHGHTSREAAIKEGKRIIGKMYWKL